MVSAESRSLSRLSKDKLIELCVSWSKSSKSNPYLASNRDAIETEEEDYLHRPAESRKDLKEIYTLIGNTREDFESLSKKDIIDRIVDGDWRRGLTQHQVASIDFAALEENDTSLRWTALKLVPLSDTNEDNHGRPAKRRRTNLSQPAELPQYPDATVSTFVQNLKNHIAPLVKAHYHVHHYTSLQLNIVRLHITPNTAFAPLNTNIPRLGRGSTEAARTMYIALPDSCPYIYVSVSGAKPPDRRNSNSTAPKIDIATTKRIVLEAIPKALSRPQQRWSIETTKLATRNLKSMLLLRGSGRVGVAGGSFASLQAQSTFSNNEASAKDEIDEQFRASEDIVEASRKRLIEQRFGPMEGCNHAKLDCVQLNVQSLTTLVKKRKVSYDDDNEPTPISIVMSGGDVFAGLKQLALFYPEYVDLRKMPAPLTGETKSTVITI